MKIKKIIFLLLFYLCSASDVFYEDLNVRPLQDGRIDIGFKFTLDSDNININHTNLFPLDLLNLYGKFKFNELHFTLSKGRWNYVDWHSPQFNKFGNSGLELWSSFDESSDMNFRDLKHSLSSLFCSSFSSHSSINEHIIYVNDKPFYHSQITTQLPCSENLSPLVSFLPCRTEAGLGQLLNSHKIFDADWYGLGLSIYETESGLNLTINIEIIANPTRNNQRRQYSLKSLFDSQINQPCLAADSSIIHFGLPENSDDPFIVLPEDHKGVLDESSSEILVNVNDINEPPNLSLIWPLNEIFKYNSNKSKPPILVTRAKSVGPTSDKFNMILSIQNTYDYPIDISYFHSIPWIVKPYLHTMSNTLNGNQFDNLNITNTLGNNYNEPYVFQLNSTIPPFSILTTACLFQKRFLKYNDYPPDIHRGIDLPPGLLFIKNTSYNDDDNKVTYTSPLLIDLSTPDFSMPYNVIIITSTLIALFYGTIYNIMVRDFILIPKQPDNKKKNE